MGRLKPLSENDLTDAQRSLLRAIISGKRSLNREPGSFLLADGSLRGPFGPWLHAPAIGRPAQELGEAIRFGSNLDPALRELAILTVAAEWRADYEWWAHRPIALKVGLTEAIVNGVKNGVLPQSARPSAHLVHDFSRQLLTRRRVSEIVYRRAVNALGESGVVELVTTLGYYTLVAMTLNAFEVDMPDGEERPFSNGAAYR